MKKTYCDACGQIEEPQKPVLEYRFEAKIYTEEQSNVETEFRFEEQAFDLCQDCVKKASEAIRIFFVDLIQAKGKLT